MPIPATSSVSGINDRAKELIDRFEKDLLNNLQAEKFTSPYSSIDDILIHKYHLTDIDTMDFPDLSAKTEFIAKGVRGNIQKAEGNILTYEEAAAMVDKSLNEEMP